MLVPGGGDPYFANVVALLHLDGADSGTSFIDVTGKTWSGIGNAATKTAQAKFGASSLYLDGMGDGILTAASSSDFAFGTGDFTLEAWIRPSASAEQYKTIIQPNNNALIALLYNANIRKIYWYNNGNVVMHGTELTIGAWAHVAAVRASGSLSLFVDGVKSASSYSESTNFSASGTARVGKPTSAFNDFFGYIDDVRISKGVARYTASFSPPAEAFPNS